MNRLKYTLRRSVCVLLAISFIWCLTLSYFILSSADWEAMAVTGHQRAQTKRDKVEIETHKVEDVMRSIIRFGDDILSILESSDNFSTTAPSPNYKEEIQELQIKMVAERAKRHVKDEMIQELRSDKRQLQLRVTRLEELLKLQMEKTEKKDGRDKPDDLIKEDKNCPLPPMDGYPHCKGKLTWMIQMWKSDPCYSGHGVNGSLCSILIYLSEIEPWCPLLPGRSLPTPETVTAEKESEAVVRQSLESLFPSLETKIQFRWIHRRISSMERVWVEAGRSLSAKYNVTGRKAKHILVHPGVLTKEAGLQIAEKAFSGGPLGELVQWSDLISALHILGHHLHFSASIPDLQYLLGTGKGGCPSKPLTWEPNLVYTDIIGLKQFQSKFQMSWIKYKCMTRVLDTFGTEPDFNHGDWAKKHKLTSPFGGLNVIPAQFYTMFPHTPDNTFLGFVVQHQLTSQLNEQPTNRQNMALVYGKSAKFWEGKEAYLDTIHKYFEIHATVDNSDKIPSYVINHGIISVPEVQALLRQSKVFVGLSFPYEGPAPLEALANGCAFLNPRLQPPQSSLNSQFFKGKPNIREVTSQHPYTEAID